MTAFFIGSSSSRQVNSSNSLYFQSRRPSLSVIALDDGIQYPHKTDEYKFLLIGLHLCFCVGEDC